MQERCSWPCIINKVVRDDLSNERIYYVVRLACPDGGGWQKEKTVATRRVSIKSWGNLLPSLKKKHPEMVRWCRKEDADAKGVNTTQLSGRAAAAHNRAAQRKREEEQQSDSDDPSLMGDVENSNNDDDDSDDKNTSNRISNTPSSLV